MHKRLMDEFPPELVASKSREEIIEDIRSCAQDLYNESSVQPREPSEVEKHLIETGTPFVPPPLEIPANEKIVMSGIAGEHLSPEEMQTRIKQMKQQFGQTLGEALTKQSMVGLGALAPKPKEFTIFDIVSNMSKKATAKAQAKQQKKKKK